MADNNFLFTHIFYYLPANLGKKQKDDRSLLTNNYFCTLKYKIMKGILPVYCRTMGYVVLLLSVFVPLLMFMFGMIMIVTCCLQRLLSSYLSGFLCL